MTYPWWLELGQSITTSVTIYWIILGIFRTHYVPGSEGRVRTGWIMSVIRPVVWLDILASFLLIVYAIPQGDGGEVVWETLSAAVTLYLLKITPDDQDFWGGVGRKIRRWAAAHRPSVAVPVPSGV